MFAGFVPVVTGGLLGSPNGSLTGESGRSAGEGVRVDGMRASGPAEAAPNIRRRGFARWNPVFLLREAGNRSQA